MTTNQRFSIVVPTAFWVRGREVEKRAMALVRSGIFSSEELIFSHGEQSKDTRFCRALEANGARVVRTQLSTKGLPLGLLRNRGADVATAKYLLFWDVDLLPCATLVLDLQRWLDASSKPFAIVPCLYASAIGTQRFAKNGVFDINRSLTAFYAHRRELIAHLALNTSTLAIERDFFRSSGGFDERFLDHGLEDLDLLVRLALGDATLPMPTDLLTDVRHQSPAFSTGFRSVLNLLSLPVFLDTIASLHQWHRRPHHAFYARRSENWALFEQNAKEAQARRPPELLSRPWSDLIRPDGTLDSLLVVHRLLSRAARPPQDPSALFDEVPQHYFHPDRAMRRLLRAAKSVLGPRKQH